MTSGAWGLVVMFWFGVPLLATLMARRASRTAPTGSAPIPLGRRVAGIGLARVVTVSFALACLTMVVIQHGVVFERRPALLVGVEMLTLTVGLLLATWRWSRRCGRQPGQARRAQLGGALIAGGVMLTLAQLGTGLLPVSLVALLVIGLGFGRLSAGAPWRSGTAWITAHVTGGALGVALVAASGSQARDRSLTRLISAFPQAAPARDSFVSAVAISDDPRAGAYGSSLRALAQDALAQTESVALTLAAALLMVFGLSVLLTPGSPRTVVDLPSATEESS